MVTIIILLLWGDLMKASGMMKRLKKIKWVLIIVVFLITITALRLTWMHYLSTFTYPNAPVAEKGILDLRGMEFTDRQTISLKGEWKFTPHSFIDPQEKISSHSDSRYIKVPNSWDEEFGENGGSSFHSGTYRLKILLDTNHEQLMGFRMNEIRNASAIYVNGQFVAGAGQPAMKVENHQPFNTPYSFTLKPTSSELDIVIHTSYHLGKRGGITKNIYFGTVEAIYFRNALSIAMQLLLGVVLLIHSLYAVLLYFLGAKNKGLLYFSILIISAFTNVLVNDDKLLFTWTQLDYDLSIKLIYFSFLGVALFMPLVIKCLFPAYGNDRFLSFFVIYCGLYSLFIIFASTTTITATSKLMLSVLLLSVFISIYLLRKIVKEKQGVIFLVLACVSIGVNILWSSYLFNTLNSIMHYPFDLIIAVLSFSAFWFRRFFRATNETKQLAEKLLLADKQKDDFLINISHELRNPLHGIINMAQSILDHHKHPISLNTKNV